MEDEVEDIVGDVMYSDSQKSIDTSHVYSMDFTDSSNSEKHNSSSKETYILEMFDSEDSEIYPLEETKSVVNFSNAHKNDNTDVKIQCQMLNQVISNRVTRTASTSIPNCSIVAQETFTQTSKTIFELAQADRHLDHLETQTSFVSVTENKTIEYRIEVSKTNVNADNTMESKHNENIQNNRILSNALEDESTKYESSDTDSNTDTETVISDDEDISDVSTPTDRIINFIQDESNDKLCEDYETKYDNRNNSDFDDDFYTDIEEDSLMEKQERKPNSLCSSDASDVPTSVDADIEELYNNLSKSIDLCKDAVPDRRFSTLSPLTEESTIKKESVIDITPDINNIKISNENIDKDILFTKDDGFKVKMLPMEDTKGPFKLPPIQNKSCPNSPHLNFLFSINNNANRLNKPGTLPSLHEDSGLGDRWEVGSHNLASGEGTLISERNTPKDKNTVHLPPIHLEGYVINSNITKTDSLLSNIIKINSTVTPKDSININEKIKELKMNSRVKIIHPKYVKTPENRSMSPSSDEAKYCETAERGCEVLTQELLKRLRSSNWFEVMSTLDEIPNALTKFWDVISEQRIADLLRQVNVHIESPRTQVARTACNTVAAILKNTNYTKKPDFYEAITLLLTKTGSFSRPVRRAANVALDEIVCAVDISHAITALCIHGVSHKSASVRCAAARLLVVCCGVRGGRGVLRTRPPTAAAARRYTLRSLAMLLDDKNTDARKYAERLYLMLRTHNSFEAYYLTDVEVEVAARQMKKYDKLLFCDQSKETR